MHRATHTALYTLVASATFLLQGTALASAPVVPNTPAAHALISWLHAFNRSKVERGFRKSSGGFDLISIERSEADYIEFLVKARSNQGEALGELNVSPKNPEHITNARFLLVPAGARLIGFKINRTTRDRVIKALIWKLRHRYVVPASGNAMARAIAARWKRGQYDSISDGLRLATQLTNELQSMSHDRHLRVAFSPAQLSNSSPRLNTASNARTKARFLRENCGFDKVERLPHNLGYIKLDEFGDSQVCGSTAVAAMSFLAHVDAIIFDLRQNHGGTVGIGELIDSYLFSRPTLLDTIVNPRTGKKLELFTLPYVRGKRRPTIPVYVLTSHETFSGGEGFAYTLQALKRATVIGEVTGGGAYLFAPERVGRRFIIDVPTGEPINPITKTNWEGTGVVPNVRVPAAQALAVAEKLAYQAISSRRSTTQSSSSQ